MVLFQHNNLRSVEWTSIRRELNQALRKVDEQQVAEGRNLPPIASHIKLQIVQTGIFEVALRIVECFRPNGQTLATARLSGAIDPSKQPSAGIPDDTASLTHDLSRIVHDSIMNHKGKHELSTLLAGPLAIISFPHVSPEHLKAALSILSPKITKFPAPTRKANPGYHDITVQDGLQKLMFLAARVDGKVFDIDGTKWIGSIEGGMDGLRAQLITALQSMGSGITSALDGASRSLYLTLESRRSVLEDEGKSTPDKSES
jgi:large subunit ribosomal protein L10